MSVLQDHGLIRKPVSASYREKLGGCSLFESVSDDVLDRLYDTCDIVCIESGRTLIAPEQSNDHLYLVLKGRLQVYLGDAALPHYLTLACGECVGELSLIDGRGTSATVIAVEDSELLEIDQGILWSLVNTCHSVARNLLHILTARVRKDNSAINDAMMQQFRLEQVANVDGLTGIHNRRWLDETFPRALDRARHDGRPLSLIIADVDHFKRHNDRYGHLSGDRVLRHVARLLAANLRPTDMLARYGGEEFAVLLPDTPVEGACLVAERIRRVVMGSPAQEPDGSAAPGVTLSAGVAGMAQGDELAALLARADRALYRAKEAGRNRVEKSNE